MKRRSRSLGTTTDFPLVRAHLKAWATDFCDSVLPWFTAQNQTALLVAGKSVSERHRRAIRRAFRRRKERVTFANSIPHGPMVVCFDLQVQKTSCSNCRESAKSLVSRVAFLSNGKVVQFDGKPRFSPSVCPACQAVAQNAPPEVSVLQQLSEF